MTPIDPVSRYAQSLLKKKNIHTADHGWGVPGALDTNRNIFFKVGKSWHFLWIVKHFSMFLENIRII